MNSKIYLTTCKEILEFRTLRVQNNQKMKLSSTEKAFNIYFLVAGQEGFELIFEPETSTGV